ncbi:hypothetical protein GGH94_004151 [Coemansia aciculifera]|uniref:DUF4246 domain-containing protein n=1 Tax=Coemansia aciculifera TaxID=417176 RepID=A0A9W8IMG2_9FUNG|nr:hypothetical protein GGH94_004151 [Coemansia aciculifera]
MSSSNDKLCLDKISHLYPTKALYEAHTVEPKTRVELRMLKASAFIRSTPEWDDQLNNEDKCQEWTTQVKDTFNLADEEVEYVFEELKYYALLKENGAGGEELGAIDNVWIANAVSNCELAEEFKCNAAVLESDFVQAELNETGAALPSKFKALVDPFLNLFSSDNSLLLETPVATPVAALDATLSGTKTGSPEDWSQAIKDLNAILSADKDAFDKREITELVRACYAVELGEEHACWLPTDFHVNDDGSVTIPSYINNLHPVRYAALYQTISKVFAKFVPLLEQVTTDMIHPRSLRAKFDRELCFKHGIDFPTELMRFIWEEKPLPSGWIEKMPYIEPVPFSFSPSDRPTKPYSMRGMPLQASVEISSINLTPENPAHPEGGWQAVGSAEERVFAVGLYFYDVENIASLKLKFRDPVGARKIVNMGAKLEFCIAHNIDEDYGDGCLYTQEVGEIEIKSGSYICYPNFYQTKMPSFELADPTRPGHLKYIAFCIVNPAIRLLSTGLVPPQQPNWINTGGSASVGEGISTQETSNVAELGDRLRRIHMESDKAAEGRFAVHMTISNGEDEDEYLIV